MKYSIIYADPPYSYYNDSDSYFDKTTRVGMRKPPYPVMSTDNIKELKINKIADENCILFIWTTDYHLEKCLKIIGWWGFKYKTVGFQWLKLNKQNKPICFMGAYTMKSGIETCLLATKGKDAHKMIIKHNVRGLVCSQRREHSEKPDEVRDRIVELCGELPRIELFAQKRFDGWDAWGNKIESDITL